MTYVISNETIIANYPETDFVDYLEKELISGFTPTSPKINIHYGFLKPHKHITSKACIVLLPGRGEPFIKYAELMHELSQNGYAVFTLDHRGQGRSSRLLDNPHIGYVDDFQDYVNDAHHCVSEVLPNLLRQAGLEPHLPILLLCHSMGGAIGSLLLQQYPKLFKKAVLSAPMFGINMPLPRFMVALICKSVLSVRERLGLPKRYFWGHADFLVKPFEVNRLTHSRLRYQIFMQLMTDQIDCQLGGVSFDWIYHAIRAMRQIEQHAKKLQTPLLVLRAEKESIVDNKAMNMLLQKIPGAILHSIPNAKHEILFESDSARSEAMTAILEFFEHI